MNNLREVLKETWGSFTDTHKPYLTLGGHFLVLRKEKNYLEWGHENIHYYLVNELHMPIMMYSLSIQAAKLIIVKFKIENPEYREVERKYSVKKVIDAGRVSKTKEEFFQRLNGTWENKSWKKKEQVGPLVFSHREMEKLRAAGRGIGFPFETPTKNDILRLAINATAHILPEDEKVDFVEKNYKRYNLFTRSQSASTISLTKS